MLAIDMLTGAAILVAFPLLMLGLLMLIAPRGVDLDELFTLPTERASTRGVPEEEPVRWQLDRLSHASGSARMPVQARAAREQASARTGSA